jgi:hypothetical protein
MVNITTATRAGALTIAIAALVFVAATVGVARASAQVVPSCSITATPSSLGSSGSVTLNWTSYGATNASLNYSIGSVGTTGSWNISVLGETRTYILTVNGTGGTSTCAVTIPVGTTSTNAPTCTLNASSTNVSTNGSTVLSWNTTNATNVYLTNVGSVATSGSYNVYPTSGTTYQLTATGAGGTTTCTQTVTVNGTNSGYNGLPTCSLAIQPDYVFANGSAVISYNASGATNAWIDGGVGPVSGIGTKTIYNITSPRTYHMTATNSNGTTTCSDVVSVAGTGYVAPTTYNTYGNSYAYPYNNYTYPTNYAYPTQYTTPTYYTPSQYYTTPSYTTAYPHAGRTVQLAAVPYTGPEDALYVGFMLALTLAIGFVVYRNRQIVLG